MRGRRLRLEAEAEKWREQRRIRFRRERSRRSIIELRPAVHQNTRASARSLARFSPTFLPGAETVPHARGECTRASINIVASDTGRSRLSLPPPSLGQVEAKSLASCTPADKPELFRFVVEVSTNFKYLSSWNCFKPVLRAEFRGFLYFSLSLFLFRRIVSKEAVRERGGR